MATTTRVQFDAQGHLIEDEGVTLESKLVEKPAANTPRLTAEEMRRQIKAGGGGEAEYNILMAEAGNAVAIKDVTKDNQDTQTRSELRHGVLTEARMVELAGDAADRGEALTEEMDRLYTATTAGHPPSEKALENLTRQFTDFAITLDEAGYDYNDAAVVEMRHTLDSLANYARTTRKNLR